MIAIASPGCLLPARGLRIAGVAWMSLHVASSVTMSTSDMALGDTRGTGGVLRLRVTNSRPGEGVKRNPVLVYNYSTSSFSLLCWWASHGFPCREAWAPQTPTGLSLLWVGFPTVSSHAAATWPYRNLVVPHPSRVYPSPKAKIGQRRGCGNVSMSE
jgi:hypothetical protein